MSWSDVLAGIPQGSILGPLLFLIYINDLSDGLQCNPKLSADDTSLFASVHNINKATNDLNNDLTKFTKWGFQWKISFNPNISKQAHEVIFSRKSFMTSHSPLIFNNIPVFFFFFLSGFSFTDTDDSQGSRGREGTIFYSTLPLPPAHEHSDNYLQLCM